MQTYPLLAVDDQSPLVPVGLAGSVGRLNDVSVGQVICENNRAIQQLYLATRVASVRQREDVDVGKPKKPKSQEDTSTLDV